MSYSIESGWSMTMNTKLLRKLIAIDLLLLGLGAAHAEGGCPPGMYAFQFSPNQPPSCAPIPVAANQQQQQQQQWERKWGAIAGDKPKGIIGSAINKASKIEAEQEALSDCAANGGSPCKLETSYDNECVAMVVGTKGYGIYVGDSKNSAAQRANQQLCTIGGDTDCRIIYSACSLPMRIR